MTRIEVAPPSLLDMAERLRSTNVAARRARRDLVEAGPEVTGNDALSAALSEHAQVWAWWLELLQDRLEERSRALADAARAYGQVEGAVAGAAGRVVGSQA